MAWLQYTSWTPHEGGDLGNQRPELNSIPSISVEDTSYHGASATNSINISDDSYEMRDLREYEIDVPRDRNFVRLTDISHRQRSQTSLTSLHPNQEPLLQKPSTDSSTYTYGSVFPNFLKRKHLTGWKFGVVTCAVTAITVCLLNIILTIWAVANHHVDNEVSSLYAGSCKEVASMSLWIHLAINVMSTLLLSASNCEFFFFLFSYFLIRGRGKDADGGSLGMDGLMKGDRYDADY